VVLFILLAVRVYYKRPRLLGTFWRPDKAATGA
jgi:hypothetical protein